MSRLERITSRIDQLEQILKQKRKINIIIACVDYDALAAAVALAVLIHHMGFEARIFHAGDFALRQKELLFRRYGLQHWIEPLERFAPSAAPPDWFALVDSSSVNDARLGWLAGVIDPVIIIDHHAVAQNFDLELLPLKVPPEQSMLGNARRSLRNTYMELKSAQSKFIWLDTSVGAASTLMIELLKRKNVLNDPNLEKHLGNMTAVLLAMGIYSDTKDLSFASERDLAAYEYACQYIARRSELDELKQANITERFEQYLRRANSQTHWVGRLLITSAGEIKPGDVHDVAEIADRLCRAHDRAEIVFVCGLFNGKVKVCARMKNCQSQESFDWFIRIIQSVFGRGAGGKRTPNGMGEGGALLHLDDFSLETQENPEPLILRRITDRMAAVAYAA